MSIDPDTFTYASADSVHGRLQRGRGAGYLAALQLSREEAHRLLIDCITRDPRIDSQVEERAQYSTALAKQLGLPLGELSSHLEEHNDKDQNTWDTSLTIETLGFLARYGAGEAATILRNYVGWGYAWDDALYQLTQCPDPGVWTGLDVVLCSRFPDIDRLDDALNWFCADDPAWIAWEVTNPTVAEVMERERKQAKERAATRQETDGAELSVQELLTRADETNVWQFRKAAQAKAQPSDAKLLLASLSLINPFAAGVALAGLETLAQPDFFDALMAFWRACPDRPRWPRVRCLSALAALPSATAIPLGREWFNSTNEHERRLAEKILKRHAEPSDAAMLREGLSSCLRDEYDQLYRLCSTLESFTRLNGIGPIPELEQAFLECRYSYARRIAARAMLVTAPDEFVKKYACECLWDCESATRELACEFVDLTSPKSLNRLRELADDANEEDHVRAAATIRLKGNVAE